MSEDRSARFGRCVMSTAGAVVLVAVLLAPSVVSAQTIATVGPTESPQRFAFELRFGGYYPNVDENVDGTPFATVFGSKSSLMTEFEFDYQITNIFVGTLGVGAAIGFMRAKANAFEHDSSNRSDDETSLWVLPLSLLAVVRFDIFAERWSVPLVPFFKFGLTYSFWWTTNANGVSSATVDGEEVTGAGGSVGLRVGGGIMFQLDWIEPAAARTFDNSFGVNHSYIFFEYYLAWVDGFGGEGRMNVGDNSWAVGLAMEF